jgi:hypothetical protein
MSSSDLLRVIPSQELGLSADIDRVIVFGVGGGRKLGPTILVHSPTLLLRLDQLTDAVDVVVFVEDSPLEPAFVATINDMLSAMGSEDGLVQFQIPAEAMKLTRDQGSKSNDVSPGSLVFISHGVDRSKLVSLRPPEVLRATALIAAVKIPPSELWVNPAGLIAARGGRIETYPRPA